MCVQASGRATALPRAPCSSMGHTALQLKGGVTGRIHRVAAIRLSTLAGAPKLHSTTLTGSTRLGGVAGAPDKEVERCGARLSQMVRHSEEYTLVADIDRQGKDKEAVATSAGINIVGLLIPRRA